MYKNISPGSPFYGKNMCVVPTPYLDRVVELAVLVGDPPISVREAVEGRQLEPQMLAILPQIKNVNHTQHSIK